MNTLRDKYCIVGVGETEYSRASGRTTRAMAVDAIRHAILDARRRPHGKRANTLLLKSRHRRLERARNVVRDR